MPIGRPRAPGTDAERAEARRAKVRVNVQAFRRRQKEKKLAAEALVEANQDPAFSFLRPEDLSESASSLATSASSPSPGWQEQEYDYADPDSWIWQLSRDLATDSPYQDAFLAATQHHNVSSHQVRDRILYEPCKRFTICCSTWIQAGALEIGLPSTQIMNDAVLASALTIVGRSRGDINMTMRGAFVQSRALRALRINLQSLALEDGKTRSMLPVQALTCAVSELLSNHSWSNFSSHLAGVGALIEHAGPESLKTRDVREHFYGYRSLQAAFSLMHGHAFFLGDPEWINPSWKHEVEISGHPLHTMLDIAFKMVPEFGVHNEGQILPLAELRNRLYRLRTIGSELDEWEQRLKTKLGGRLYNKMDAAWIGLYDYAFDFANLSTGIAFAMYTGSRIKLAAVTKEVMLELAAQDPRAAIDVGEAVWAGLKWARQALQSLEYFHTGRPKATGKIVTFFPLDAAWAFISEVHAEGRINLIKEQQWCLSTAHRLTSIEPEYPLFGWR